MSSPAYLTWHAERLPVIHAAEALAIDTTTTTTHGALNTQSGVALGACLTVATAEFQAFCEDLFQQSADAFCAPMEQAGLDSVAEVVRVQLGRKTQLSGGNPRLPALVGDFGRMGIALKSSVLIGEGPLTRDDITDLSDTVMPSRNKFSHGHARATDAAFGEPPEPLTIQRIIGWTELLDRAALTLDHVITRSLENRTGQQPWQEGEDERL